MDPDAPKLPPAEAPQLFATQDLESASRLPQPKKLIFACGVGLMALYYFASGGGFDYLYRLGRVGRFTIGALVVAALAAIVAFAVSLRQPWYPTLEERRAVTADLVGTGLFLIALGFAHFSMQMLASDWGFVLIGVGVTVIVFRHRIMYYLLGIVLLLAGIGNTLGSGAQPVWLGVGLMQLFWGSRAINRAKRLA
jgi:hypothetical protein